ncbi:hypothetical protein HNQ50_002556 [Silvimonas terrae]|uniref:Uncharacterized protein n=1 Tax=Silvimonas terrae TaxID=300266 RepID=A0A840RHM2_9NEIS|nr:hypothetical protein [Silvimonas terrae]MBB5191826.1 hypothetical protein [Silvimonas terrae]
MRMIPSLSFLKSMAEEKLDVNVTGAKGVLIESEGQWKPGPLVEETEHCQTFFIPESFKADSGVNTRPYPPGYGLVLTPCSPEPAERGKPLSPRVATVGNPGLARRSRITYT